MHSEREFIRKLRGRFQSQPPILTGIGDDGAVIDVADTNRHVVVTDMLLDGTHFDLDKCSPNLAGRKAIAVNLSDLAAMACCPVAGFVSLAIPRSLPDAETFLEQLFDGIEQIGREYNCPVAGGDTNTWSGPFAINVCLIGKPLGREPILRSGAQAGDILYVTGSLGGSLHSDRHLTFLPRIDVAQKLTSTKHVHSMMDISDGLAIDLMRMMEASHCGAQVDEPLIPVHTDVSAALSDDDRIRRALTDGEDFELLVAASPDATDLAEYCADVCTLHRIGQVTDRTGIVQSVDAAGRTKTMIEGGWQHL